MYFNHYSQMTDLLIHQFLQTPKTAQLKRPERVHNQHDPFLASPFVVSRYPSKKKANEPSSDREMSSEKAKHETRLVAVPHHHCVALPVRLESFGRVVLLVNHRTKWSVMLRLLARVRVMCCAQSSRQRWLIEWKWGAVMVSAQPNPLHASPKRRCLRKFHKKRCTNRPTHFRCMGVAWTIKVPLRLIKSNSLPMK